MMYTFLMLSSVVAVVTETPRAHLDETMPEPSPVVATVMNCQYVRYATASRVAAAVAT